MFKPNLQDNPYEEFDSSKLTKKRLNEDGLKPLRRGFSTISGQNRSYSSVEQKSIQLLRHS